MKKLSRRRLGALQHLTVRIQSFSCKKGNPLPDKKHGGGYMFDCRILPNPGIENRFKKLTGQDKAVVRWLDKKPETQQFMAVIQSLLGTIVTGCHKGNFEGINISFGCTGGQHRSVYCAEKTAQYLRTLGVNIELTHREKNSWHR